MITYRRFAWFFGLVGIIATILFFVVFAVIYSNMERFNEIPAHAQSDNLLVLFLFVSWIAYIISCFSIVKYKVQENKYLGLGLLGFVGLLIALFLKNKTVKVHAPVPDPEETMTVEPIRLRTVDGKYVNIKMKADVPVEVQIEGEGGTPPQKPAHTPATHPPQKGHGTPAPDHGHGAPNSHH